MAHLMLVNPKRRKARRKTARKAASANPRRRRRSRRSRKRAIGYAVGSGRIRRRKLNPRRRMRRRARRNPKFSIRSISRDAIMPAAIGGAGALALDVAFGALPIPSQFKTGIMGNVAKIVGALIVGKIAGKAFGSKIGDAVTVGAVTIQAYNAIKGQVQKAMPNLALGEYLDAAWPYAPQPGMGYVNPAMVTENLLPYQETGPVAESAPYMGEYLSGYGEGYSDY